MSHRRPSGQPVRILLTPFAASLVLVALPLTGQAIEADSAPAELKQFIGPGESLLDHVLVDLNGDGRKDAVLIVEPSHVDEKARLDGEAEGIRTLKIALRSPKGFLKVVKENRKIAFSRSCGGMFGDPFDGLSASSKGFTVSNYGRSAWRWNFTSTFAYSRRDATWQLVSVEQSSFHASDPDTIESKRYRPPRDFGEIDIADFDPGRFMGVGPK